MTCKGKNCFSMAHIHIIQIPIPTAIHDIGTTKNNAIAWALFLTFKGFLFFSYSIDRIFASLWFTSSIFRIYNAFRAFFFHWKYIEIFFSLTLLFLFIFSELFLVVTFPSGVVVFGIDNDFHISKSFALTNSTPAVLSEQQKCFALFKFIQGTNKKERIEKWWKDKHIEYRFECACSANDSNLYASSDSMKESAKLNANTMDRWMNRKWKFSVDFCFFPLFFLCSAARWMCNVLCKLQRSQLIQNDINASRIATGRNGEKGEKNGKKIQGTQ